MNPSPFVGSVREYRTYRDALGSWRHKLRWQALCKQEPLRLLGAFTVLALWILLGAWTSISNYTTPDYVTEALLPRHPNTSNLAPPPSASPKQASENLWQDTNVVWAWIHNLEARLHYQELARQENRRRKLDAFRTSLFREPQSKSLVKHRLFWLIFTLLSITTVLGTADLIYRANHYRKSRPKAHLPLATAIAFTIAQDTNAAATQANPGGETAALLPWSHEVLSPGLLEAVVLDSRFRNLLDEHEDESQDTIDFGRLIESPKFRYLLLSIADERFFWKKNLQKVVATIEGHLPKSSGDATASQQGLSLGLGTLALLLVAASIVPSITQAVSTYKITDRIENERTDTQRLIERYIPLPNSSPHPAQPVQSDQALSGTLGSYHQDFKTGEVALDAGFNKVQSSLADVKGAITELPAALDHGSPKTLTLSIPNLPVLCCQSPNMTIPPKVDITVTAAKPSADPNQKFISGGEVEAIFSPTIPTATMESMTNSNRT